MINYKLPLWLVFPLLLSLVFSSGVGVFSFTYAQENKTASLNLPQTETARGTLNLSDFSGGLNRKAYPTQLKDNEAQTLNNAWWNKFGALGRRKGWTHFPIPDSNAFINGLYKYYKQNDTSYLLVGGDTALYRAKNDSTSFVKIIGNLETGGQFEFITYKDKAVITYPNQITFAFDGSNIFNLGLIDTIRAESIYASACTTIYKIPGKVWDIDEYVSYLIYTPFNEENPYEVICKNTSNRLYTYINQNLVQNNGFEMDSQSISTPRHWQKSGNGTFDRVTDKDSGSYAGQILGGISGYTYGRQLIKNVDDSTVYNIQVRYRTDLFLNSAVIQVRSGDLAETLIDFTAASSNEWETFTDTFYTANYDSVYIYLGNPNSTYEFYVDNIHIRRKFYSYPSGDIYLYNWFNNGIIIEQSSLDSFQLDGCREYLYGITGTNWTNHIIEITDGFAKGSKGLIKTINNYNYVEPPFSPDIQPGTYPHYKIYPLTFYQSQYLEVFRNRLILANDSNLIYYSNVNEWNFPPLNLMTTYGSQGDKITGLMTLYNDQMGQRASPEDRLLILKQNNLFATDDNFIPYVITTGVGAISPRSIVNCEGLFVGFAHTSGYYITDGNKVTLISEKIKPFWDNINKSKMNLISAGYFDRHLFISVPYGSSTENDTGLIYNIDNQSWSTANIKASIFANQWGLQDTVKFIWGRPDTGWVCRYGTSNLDNGTDSITLTYKSKEFDLGDLSQRKSFKEMYLAYDKTLNLTLNFYKDFGSTATWSKTVTGTGKDIKKVLIPNIIYGKTLSWGLSSKDPNIIIGNVQIKFSFVGGL